MKTNLTKKIYKQIVNLFDFLGKNDWIKNFIFWELEIIKLVGYDINFNDYVDKSKIQDNQSHVPLIDGSKEIPHFLLNDKQYN